MPKFYLVECSFPSSAPFLSSEFLYYILNQIDPYSVVNIYHMYMDPVGGKVVICKQRKSRILYLIAFALLEAIISWKVTTLTDINFLNREERKRQCFNNMLFNNRLRRQNLLKSANCGPNPRFL